MRHSLIDLIVWVIALALLDLLVEICVIILKGFSPFYPIIAFEIHKINLKL